MLRYFQAYMSVKDTLYPHPVERTLSTFQEVVQIRLSVLTFTIGSFFFAILAVVFVGTTNRRNGVPWIHLPSSQLGWMAQAAREHIGCHTGPKAIPPRDRFQPALFASRNQDLALIINPDFEPRIATANELLVPLLEHTIGSPESKWDQACEPSPISSNSPLPDDKEKVSVDVFALDV